MNHLPFLLTVAVVIVAGILLFTGDRDEEEEDGPAPTPPGGEPQAADSPAQPPPPPATEELEELEPPPEQLRPDGSKVDLSLRIPEFHVEDVGHTDALESIGRLLDCEVSFSDEAWQQIESALLTLKVTDVGVTTVLHLLTEPHGVVYRIHHGVLWILMPGEEPPEAAR